MFENKRKEYYVMSLKISLSFTKTVLYMYSLWNKCWNWSCDWKGALIINVKVVLAKVALTVYFTNYASKICSWWFNFKLESIFATASVASKKLLQSVSGISILGSKMIIFESTLTTFEASFIFWGSWGSIKNWFELKIEPPLADLALLNPWNTLYKSGQKWLKKYHLANLI